ncbi:MAG: hypothetical protein CSB48_12610 [Proteobacteria bacterium]|nr:MAG: hypothetical protein CSB48_12610 [Pseudomonadota bacterium]
MKKEITVLVHGFNKDKSDMVYLESGLKSAGFDVLSVNLPTTFGSLEQCRNSLFLQTREILNGVELVNYVAHSMGGLITRSFIDFIGQENVGKCVFIATPHGGSRLALMADCIPLYSTLFKPVKNLLPNLSYRSFGSDKKFRIGVIAGCRNDGLIGKLFMPEESDGRVEVSSAKASDMDDFVIVPYGHASIHHERQTLGLVKRFLLTGSF